MKTIENTGRVMVLPYKIESKSAERLAKGLGIKRILPEPERTKFVGRNNDVVINWGNSRMRPREKINQSVLILNPPEAIANAANKTKTFQILHNNGVSIPEFTTDEIMATEWLNTEKYRRVFCRETTTGHSGRGIRVAREPAEVIYAPLYVAGIPKKTEYRIHVFRSNVFDRQEKRAMRNVKEEMGDDWESGIRTRENGWIFARENVEQIKEVDDQALKSISALGLDFGAVDIAVDKHGKPYVLEVNTSPNLEGTTLENYRQVFKNVLGL